ncbi:acyl-CoA thioesterase [Pistricoccus aurantiacus]|uniref:Acyl-CoA thioesterase n=1 Tax=Pistricoccus aurantiacus TaxID=1883414 RepID=A0A5B8SRJ6_9GAMM|nr:thioesterase family protein [Pistricoccus aurantiacus]QEA38864.1 acyl-CoA thioesterase [Pistricoccus aurantiacus]
MFTKTMEIGFYDTDALGHVNNTRLPTWFELARNDLFRLFTPDLDPAKWQLILARYDVEFMAELFYGKPVEIRTYLTHLGNSSFTVTQEARQESRLVARGNTVLVHYDHRERRTLRIEGELREALNAHLQEKAEA